MGAGHRVLVFITMFRRCLGLLTFVLTGAIAELKSWSEAEHLLSSAMDYNTWSFTSLFSCRPVPHVIVFMHGSSSTLIQI